MQPTADEQRALAELLVQQRWAALATQQAGEPNAAMVAYAVEPQFAGFLMLLSRLSLHTRHLLAERRACLLVSQPDVNVDDPQTLPRAAVAGAVEVIARDGPDYEKARDCYCARLPASARLFGFGDFELFRLVPREVRFVAGFGRAMTLDAGQLACCAHA